MRIGQGMGVTSRKSLVPILGSELLVNGDFEGGATGWTVTGADATHIATFSGGQLRIQSDTTSPQLQLSQVVLTVGKLYQVVYVISARVGGSLKTDAFGAAGTGVLNATGTITRRGTAIQTGYNLTRSTTGVDMTFDSISIREIVGYK